MNTRRGFTLTELLVVIGIIAVLIGLLMVALGGVRSSAMMTKSMGNMRQIGAWMRMYSSDNREFIVPSRFDYSDNPYPGKVRSVVSQGHGVPEEHVGTWADILWTVYKVGAFPQAAAYMPPGQDYQFDSPDSYLYTETGIDFDNPLRSAAQNTSRVHNGHGPTPFGTGAQDVGQPGYFAANNFFDSRDPTDGGNGWFATGQIKSPERSMYLVDSFAGETIEDEPEPFQRAAVMGGPDGVPTLEVDFRYSGVVCLMLYLDGHVKPEGQWEDIWQLECPGGRGIRIRDLNRRSAPSDCP